MSLLEKGKACVIFVPVDEIGRPILGLSDAKKAWNSRTERGRWVADKVQSKKRVHMLLLQSMAASSVVHSHH